MENSPNSHNENNPFYRVYTREEYINSGTGDKKDIRAKIYDLNEFIKSDEFKSKPVRDRLKIKKDLYKLYEEKDGPKLVDDDTFYDISFTGNEIGYDENGMRSDDEYNPKNWQ